MRSDMGQSRYQLTFGGPSKPYSEFEWYTDPIHYPATSPEKDRHNRTAGELGSLLAIQGPESSAVTTKALTSQELEDYPLTRQDFLSLRYFPITLGSSIDESIDDFSQRQPSFLDRNVPRTQSAYSTKRSTSKFVDNTFDPTKRLDSLYLMSQEAPSIGKFDIEV